jgi:hypothetical protein
MDEAASQEQAEALGAVFSGQKGGPMEIVAPLVGETLGMEVAPIEYADDGRRHRVKIGDLVDIEVEASSRSRPRKERSRGSSACSIPLTRR